MSVWIRPPRIARPARRLRRDGPATTTAYQLFESPPATMQRAEVADCAALVFVGLSAWLLVSGVFAAAAWEIGGAPERYALYSHLDVAVQVPNVVPAVLVLCTPEGWLAANALRCCGVLLLISVVDGVWLSCAASLRTEHDSIGLLIGAALGGLVGTTAMGKPAEPRITA